MAPRAAALAALPCPAPALPCPVCHQLHREWAVTERLFQALPTQTDTTVALIIKNVTLDMEKQGLSFEMALFHFLFPHGHGAYDNIISLMNI
jgi:hypothetical protein